MHFPEMSSGWIHVIIKRANETLRDAPLPEGVERVSMRDRNARFALRQILLLPSGAEALWVDPESVPARRRMRLWMVKTLSVALRGNIHDAFITRSKGYPDIATLIAECFISCARNGRTHRTEEHASLLAIEGLLLFHQNDDWTPFLRKLTWMARNPSTIEEVLERIRNSTPIDNRDAKPTKTGKLPKTDPSGGYSRNNLMAVYKGLIYAFGDQVSWATMIVAKAMWAEMDLRRLMAVIQKVVPD